MIGSVQDQVLAHDSQANEAKISTGFRLRRSTDIDAGETRTTVSITFLSIQCAMMNVQGKGVEFDVLMDPPRQICRLRECSGAAYGEGIAKLSRWTYTAWSDMMKSFVLLGLELWWNEEDKRISLLDQSWI
jgi:hypothetical protein